MSHAHLGAVFKKKVIMGAHLIDVFANDNERAGSYQEGRTRPGTGIRLRRWDVNPKSPARQPQDPKPSIWIGGLDVKLLGGVLGDGYIGYSHLSADERALPGGRDRGAALVRGLAAARQLLRAAGRH